MEVEEEYIIRPLEDQTINNSDYYTKVEEEQGSTLGKKTTRVALDEKGLLLLKNVTAGDIKKDIHALAWLKPEHTIAEALQTMSQQSVSFAPVYDSDKKNFIGFVDTQDLSMFLVMAFGEQYKAHPHLYDPKELQVNFSRPVSQFINASQHDPFIKVSYKEDLYSVLRYFLSKGVHRVAVTDDADIVILISQYDIAGFLKANISMFSETANMTLELFSTSRVGLLSVTNQDTLATALMTLLQHQVSGLAVVDSISGSIVDNISPSDLRGIDAQSIYKLEAPIHQLYSYNTHRISPVICTPHSRIVDIMESMTTHHVRRIYIVDTQGKPITVVTHTDLFKFFVGDV